MFYFSLRPFCTIVTNVCAHYGKGGRLFESLLHTRKQEGIYHYCTRRQVEHFNLVFLFPESVYFSDRLVPVYRTEPLRATFQTCLLLFLFLQFLVLNHVCTRRELGMERAGTHKRLLIRPLVNWNLHSRSRGFSKG